MKANSAKQLNPVETDSFSSTTIAALLFLAAKFPYRQFNSAELCILSGIGRTAMSQIKNAADTPFSLGKCTLQRLDAWLAKRPGFKQHGERNSQEHHDPWAARSNRKAALRGIWADDFYALCSGAGLLRSSLGRESRDHARDRARYASRTRCG